jgi:hypothetical protein
MRSRREGETSLFGKKTDIRVLVREQSETELIRKKLLTEDEIFEYPLLFGDQLDYAVSSPLLKSRASSSLRARRGAGHSAGGLRALHCSQVRFRRLWSPSGMSILKNGFLEFFVRIRGRGRRICASQRNTLGVR